jgi:hypothetical protein
MYDATRLAELIAAIQGPPDDDSRALTRALLDSPRTGAKTSADLLNAQRRTRFGEAACRHLVGETLADALAIPRTTWRFSVPILTRLVRGAELLRASVSFPDGPAIAVGSRYWDRVVQVGLAGATAEFVLPDKLAAA